MLGATPVPQNTGTSLLKDFFGLSVGYTALNMDNDSSLCRVAVININQ